MRLGVAAWGLREMGLEAQLAFTAGLGVDLLELSIGNHPNDFLQLDADDARVAEARRLFNRYGVHPHCAATGNDFTGGDMAGSLAKVKRATDLAACMGAKWLRIFAGFSSDSEVWGERFERMIDALAEVARYAAAAGVELVVETHGGVVAQPGGALTHFASVTTRVDYWPAILASGVYMNYDPANLAAVGDSDPAAWYGRFRDGILYVHLKDFRDVPGGIAPAACGEGRLDWPRLMGVLASYAGPALIEYERSEDVEDGTRRSLAFLRSFTDATGADA